MAPVKQSSPFTNFIVKETATLTWTITEFAQVEEDQSPYFSSPIDSEHKFRLELNTTNGTFRLDRVFLELYYDGLKKTQALFWYRISVLDANGEKHYTKEYLWKYQDYSDYDYHRYNVTNYITRDECNELLVNGSLNIYCEVDIFAEKFPLQQIESFGILSENYETLAESGKFSDFVVQIGDKKLSVHNNILAARSVVFAAMFEHGDTKEVKDGRVVIEDVAADVFELLIRYIYTGKVDQLGEHVDELLVAADKYQLDYLKSICEQSLISSLSVESICALLLISDMHNAQQLKSKCIEYMVEHAKEVMQTEGWKELADSKRIDLVMELFAKSTIKDD